MPVSRDWDFARDKKTLEHGKKLARMHEWSWFRVQTPGDGNCAFHALAQNMKRLRYIWTIMNWDDTTLATLPMSASAWRHACVSFIEKYAVILDINKIWTESSPGFGLRCSTMQCERAYADSLLGYVRSIGGWQPRCVPNLVYRTGAPVDQTSTERGHRTRRETAGTNEHALWRATGRQGDEQR